MFNSKFRNLGTISFNYYMYCYIATKFIPISFYWSRVWRRLSLTRLNYSLNKHNFILSSIKGVWWKSNFALCILLTNRWNKRRFKEDKKRDRKHQWDTADLKGLSDQRGRSVSPNCSHKRIPLRWLFKAVIADRSVVIFLTNVSCVPQEQLHIHKRDQSAASYIFAFNNSLSE